MANWFELEGGNDHSRLIEDHSPDSKTYFYYGAGEIDHDLFNEESKIDRTQLKQIRLADEVPVFKAGDIALSIMNPRAAIVSKECDGFLHTRNFLKIIPSKELDPKYFVYLVNQNKEARRLLLSDNGKAMPHERTTTRSVKSLQKMKLPPLEKQKLIGEIYFLQLHLSALLAKKARLEEQRTFEILRRKAHGKN